MSILFKIIYLEKKNKIKLVVKQYFSVPIDQPLRNKWIEQICRHQTFDPVPIRYPICALHFDPECIVKHGKRTTLKKGTVPTYFPELVVQIKLDYSIFFTIFFHILIASMVV